MGGDVVRTGIIGLGALGSSLGLALRSKREWSEVTGFDASARVQNEAKRKGAIAEGTRDVADLLSDADLVVLAIPPLAVVQFLREYGAHVRADAVITDLAATKQVILETAARHVPARSGFVGGHPLVSRAPGIAQATATLYQGRTWCLTAGDGTPEACLDRVSGLVRAAGAVPYFVDPAEHDAWIAGVEGLPLILAAALARVEAGSDAWRELVRAAGAPFADAVRAASYGTANGHDLALTGGSALVSWLDRLLAELDGWREAIAERNSDVLTQRFADVAAAHERWEQERVRQAKEGGAL
jgi:prephenate dehydrogenase